MALELFALLPNLVTRWRHLHLTNSYKFSHQMLPLALVSNLFTRCSPGRNAHLWSKLITLHYHQPHSRRWSMTVSGKAAQMIENPLTSVLPLSAVVKQRASQSVPVLKTSGASWGLQEKRKKMLLKIHAKTVRQRCTSMSVVQKNRVFVLTAVMSWEPA